MVIHSARVEFSIADRPTEFGLGMNEIHWQLPYHMVIDCRRIVSMIEKIIKLGHVLQVASDPAVSMQGT